MSVETDTIVVNMHTDSAGARGMLAAIDAGAFVRIDLQTKWGNPYANGPFSREWKLAAYERWIRSRPDLIRALPELRGKVLGCWCRPLPCHGDVLIRLLAEQDAPADMNRLKTAVLDG